MFNCWTILPKMDDLIVQWTIVWGLTGCELIEEGLTVQATTDLLGSNTVSV
jgi:hypothetical protein